ncbi:MAG: PAS domain-containing protein [Deltaproteobacteria bacterium]|nr:PAS domain-containing protein [Deltaproteobacteria bacterium]
MGEEKRTYEELEARLADAEEVIRALRNGKVDAVIGERSVYLLRLHEMEKALHESELRFRRLKEGNIIGVVVADMWRVLDANDIFLNMVGYTQQDLVEGKIDWQAMTPPEYVQRSQEGLEQLGETGFCRTFEKEYVRKDGTRVPVLIGASLLSHDPMTWICFILDLTELKEAQRERESRLARQVELSDVSMKILGQTDISGLLDVVASAARTLTGAKLAGCGHCSVNGQFVTGAASRAEDISACPEGDMFAAMRGGVFMEVIEKSPSLRLTDAEMRHHPQWRGLPENHAPLDGLLSARLVGSADGPNGMILVSHKGQGEFTEEDERILQQLASLTSLALQNLAVREALEHSVRERTADLEARTAELENANRVMQKEMGRRERLERDLKKGEARLRMAIEASGAGIFEHNVPLDSETFFSERWANILGYTREELPQPESFMRWLDQLIHPEDRPKLYRTYQAFIEGRSPFDVEIRMKHKSGEWVFVRSLTHAASRDETGRVNRVVGVMLDITKHKKTEGRLKRSNRKIIEEYKRRKFLAQRLVRLLERDRSEMAMALHDHAGQLLTALRMELEMIKEDLPGNPVLGRLESSEKRTIELLDFIRNVSRNLRPAALDTIGLIPCVAALVDTMKRNAGINIQFYTKGIPQRLHPDKELALYRIIQESLNNVWKYADADFVFINLVLKGETIHLSVDDNGAGFDYREVSNRIDSQDGPLGLSIMKERAVQVGGELWIESEKGKGAVVFARIPLNEGKDGSEEETGEETASGETP